MVTASVVRLVLLAVVGSTAACSSGWTESGGQFDSVGLGIEIEIPPQWQRIRSAPRDSIILTLNGISLEAITVSRWEVDQKLPGSKMRFRRYMQPHEAAAVEIDRRKFSVDDFQLVGEQPATVGDRPCYRVAFEYRARSRQQRKAVTYGCLKDEWVYRLHYDAPSESHFPRYLPAFESVVASARFS